MKPEDIDKLFSERLGKSAPTPPADLWNRLQERMAEEAPQPLQLPQEEKRSFSFMWVSSSMAAAVSLLLTVGIVFYNVKTGTPEISETIAKHEQKALKETPVYTAPEPAVVEEPAPLASADQNISEIISEPQATEEATPASKVTERVAKPEAVAKANTVARAQRKAAANRTATTQPVAIEQPAIAANKPAAQPAEPEAEVVLPAAKPVTPTALASAAATSADMNAAPVEIIIKRSSSSPTVEAEADEPRGIEKKAKLAKNIFKQVRNLANGESVELAELGIRADKVALETQIGKQKFSKVINL